MIGSQSDKLYSSQLGPNLRTRDYMWPKHSKHAHVSQQSYTDNTQSGNIDYIENDKWNMIEIGGIIYWLSSIQGNIINWGQKSINQGFFEQHRVKQLKW